MASVPNQIKYLYNQVKCIEKTLETCCAEYETALEFNPLSKILTATFANGSIRTTTIPTEERPSLQDIYNGDFGTNNFTNNLYVLSPDTDKYFDMTVGDNSDDNFLSVHLGGDDGGSPYYEFMGDRAGLALNVGNGYNSFFWYGYSENSDADSWAEFAPNLIYLQAVDYDGGIRYADLSFRNGTFTFSSRVGSSDFILKSPANAQQVGADSTVTFPYKSGNWYVPYTVNNIASDINGNITIPLVEPTGLERLDNESPDGPGWRLIGRDPLNYATLGWGAVDFSVSNSVGSIYGASGNSSVSFGGDSIIQGISAFNVGWGNSILSDPAGGANVNYSSVAFGDQNNIDKLSSYSFIHGYGGEITNSYGSNNQGYYNVIQNSSGSSSLGDYGEVKNAPYSSVFGYYNRILGSVTGYTANNSFIFGTRNTSYGIANTIFGGYNYANTYSDSITSGRGNLNNMINSYYPAAPPSGGGLYDPIPATTAIAGLSGAGSHLFGVALESHQGVGGMVVGTANVPIDNSPMGNAATDAMLIVGNGTFSSGNNQFWYPISRSNALEVYRGGEVKAPSLNSAKILADTTGKVLLTKEVGVSNETDSYASFAKVTNIITLTQAEYDAIPTPEAGTWYAIIEP